MLFQVKSPALYPPNSLFEVRTYVEVWISEKGDCTTSKVVVVPGIQDVQAASVVAPLVVPNGGAVGEGAAPDQTVPPGAV